ncbi:11055_t:CDS:2, partial [Rhizophagus irregularis]
MALKYFVDNFDKKYVKNYKPEEIDIAFLPCSNSNSYAKHSECFINDECKIMGFNIIRQDLRSKAGDFGVRQNPNRVKIINKLIENPPKNVNVAKKVFEYLNTQQKGFIDSDWKMLKDLEFIPIQHDKLIKPRDCFLKLKEESLNNFFTYIDFGTKANEFLAKCGVREPSSNDFAEISVDPSHELWNLYVEKYPIILEKINPNLVKILKLATPPTNPKLHAMALKYF